MEIKIYCMNPDECKDKRVYLTKDRAEYKTFRKVQICTKKRGCDLAVPISQPPSFF